MFPELADEEVRLVAQAVAKLTGDLEKVDATLLYLLD